MSLRARSALECHLYMDLHPCGCGEARLVGGHRVEQQGDDLVAVYDGPCAGCGAARRFAFVLDPEIVPADQYGGAAPSSILDPGEFLRAADDAAARVPGAIAGLTGQARTAAATRMSRAAAAIAEILKFIPPGADRVPPAAFTSVAGKAVYAREPGRFRRPRLEAVLAVYRDAAAQLR